MIASRLGRSLVLSVVLAGASVAPAVAALSMSGTSEPATIAFPGSSTVTYALTLSATGRDEHFGLQTDLPLFGGDTRNPTAAAGASLHPTEWPTVEGPATLPGPGGQTTGTLACGPGLAAHGTDTWRLKWDVIVPADTTSTLRFVFAAGTRPPWPMTDYDVTFVATPRLTDPRVMGTLAAAQSVTITGPRPTGTQGVRLTMASLPRTGVSLGEKATRVGVGRRIRIAGTTTPHMRGARVSIWTAVGNGPNRRRLTVRTDKHGRYTATLRPQRAAFLSVMATLAATGTRYASEYTCPLEFNVVAGAHAHAR